MSRAFNGLVQGQPATDLASVESALNKVGDAMQRRITSAASQQLAAGWGQELSQQGGFNSAQRTIVKTDPSAAAHSLGLRVSTGGGRRGGFLWGSLVREYEFGTLNRNKVRTYDRANLKSGGKHKVTRHTARQLPPRSQTGWIAYPSAGKLASRAFAMFLQIAVKTIHDGLEGK